MCCYKVDARSNNVQGGGVGLFVKEGLKINVMENLSIFIDQIIETQFIEVETSPGHTIIVASIYRPNTHSTLTSTAQLEQF